MVTLPPLPTINPTDSGTSGDYGLSKDASTQKFDVTGLGIPGLSGMVDGQTLLQYFIASGSGRLGDGGQAAAAIQHALLYAQAYGDSTFQPTLGRVGEKDASAFAQALNLLGKSNATQPDTVPGMQTPTETVAGYLARNAAIGVENGSLGGSKVTNLRDVANVRTPDTTTLMAVADKAFQAVQGRRASIAEQRAFAQSFQQLYTQTETANNDAVYQATLNSKMAAAPSASLPAQQAQPDPLAAMRAQQQQRPPGMPRNAELGMGEGDVLPPELGPVMDSLTQAAAPAPDQTLTGLTNVTTQALPTAAGAAAYAENFARNANPKGAAANDTANVFDMFRQILESHFGG